MAGEPPVGDPVLAQSIPTDSPCLTGLAGAQVADGQPRSARALDGTARVSPHPSAKFSHLTIQLADWAKRHTTIRSELEPDSSWMAESIGEEIDEMRPRKTFRFRGLAALLFVGVFAVAACGSPTPAETATEVQPERSAAGAASAANLAVDFETDVYTAQDLLGGQDVHFSDIFSSGKPVVLNYWAGLCPPCRAEIPDIQEAHDAYHDKVTIFGLDIGPFIGLGSIEDGKTLMKQLGVTYPTGTTLDPEIIREHPPLGMPTTLFITPDGDVYKRWTGLLTKDKLGELTAELLEASDSQPS